MNWWEWVFSGIGVLIIGLFVQRWLKSSSERKSNLTAQGARVSNSPVASGTGITQTISETHHHYTQPTTQPQTAQPSTPDPVPNLQIMGANNILIQVTDNDLFAQSNDDEGPVAAVVRVTNDAQPNTNNVGAEVRATLIFENSNGHQLVRVAGAWLGELTDSINFHVDDERTVIVGVKTDWQFYVPGKRRAPYEAGYGVGYVTDAHEIGLDNVTVTLRLTNADTGAFYCERQFQVQINPTLNIQMVP